MSGQVINKPDDFRDSVTSTGAFGGQWDRTNPYVAGTHITGAIETGLYQGKQDYDTFKVTLSAGVYEIVRNEVDANPLGRLVANMINANGTAITELQGISVDTPGTSVMGSRYIQVTQTTDYYVQVFSACCVCTGYYDFSFKAVQGINDLPADNTTGAKVASGAPVLGSVEIAGDVDFIKFTVPAKSDNQYFIAVEGYDASANDGRNTALGDPGILLYTSNGTTTAVSATGKNLVQNANGSKDAYAIVHLANSTSLAVDYYVSVFSQDKTRTGDYKVSVNDVPYGAWYNYSYDDYPSSNKNTVLSLDGARISGVVNIPEDYLTGTPYTVQHPDFDHFKINLVAGVTYALRMEKTEGSTVDPLLFLLDANLKEISNNDNKTADPYGKVSAATANDSLILYTPTKSGVYYLAATGVGATLGNYKVSAQAIDDAAGSNQTIQRVVVNRAPVEGQIELAGDSDWYGIYLSAGTAYEFKADQATSYALSNPLLSLRDASGVAVATNDNANGLNSQIRFTAKTSGMYYLDVQDSGSGTGRYLVSASAQDDLVANTDTTGVIDLSSAAGGAGRIDFGGDVDWLQIDLERGADYIVRVQGAASGGGLTLADPRLLGVYDSKGVLIHNSGNDDYGNTRNAYVRFTPDQTARYYLAIAGSSLDDLGSYRINVEKETFNDVAASVATRSVLSVGDTVTGSIESFGDKDWYSLQLTQGQTYVIDLIGDVTHTQVLRDTVLGGIYAADGTLIANTNNNYGASLNSRMLYTASSTGTYFIEAKGNTGYTGDYQLGVKNLAQVSDAVGDSVVSHGTLVLNHGAGSVNGSVDVARDVDWYAVSLTQGTLYDVTLRGAASGMGSLLDPRLYGIYDSTGKMILGSGADAGDGGVDVRTNFLATSTGTYYLAAGGTADMTGTYRMEVRPAGITDDVVANITTTALMYVGSSYTGQIETIGDRDWIRVDLAANKDITITMDSVSESLGAVTMPVIANLYKASGEAVYLLPNDPGFDKNDLKSIRTFTCTEAGTYYIEVKSLNEGIGGYRVQVNEANSAAGFAPELLGDFIDHDATQPSSQAALAALPHYSTSMPVDGVITLTFGKPKNNQDSISDDFVEDYLNCNMFKGSGKITIMGNGQTLEIDVNSKQVSISGNTVTINPDVNFLPNTEYGLIMDAGTLVDASGTPFAGIGVERTTTYFDGVKGYFSIAPNLVVYTWTTTTINDPNEFLFRTAPVSTEPVKDDWTLMVYMAADNELEAQALADLREMFAAQLPDKVNVVVMVDRAAGYDGSDGNWTGAYQGLLKQGMTVADVATQWTSLGEVNTGSETTLQSFISSVKSNAAYAANHYGLVVWGPGGGTSGTAWDHSAGLDNLSLAELRGAMTGAGMTASSTGLQADSTDPLKLLGAALAGDNRQVVLTYNQSVYDMTSSDGTLDGHKPFTGAFQYKIGAGEWQNAVAWDVKGSAITLDLGVSVNSGEVIDVKYNSDYHPTYFHTYTAYNDGGLLGTKLNNTTDQWSDDFSAIRTESKSASAASFSVSITDNKFDLLAFDSSLMGLTETLWEVKDNVHQMVASEDIVPSTGFNYADWLSQLANNSAMPASELATKLVQTYFDQNAGGISASMAAYDVNKVMANQNGSGVPNILYTINAFADYAIQNGTAQEWAVIHDAAVNAITSPTHDAQVDYLRDVSDFLQHLWVYLPNGELFKRANAALGAVMEASTFSKTLDSGSLGLGIYMPLGMPVDPNYTGDYLTFLNSSYGLSNGTPLTPQWDDFVRKLQLDLANTAPTSLVIFPELTTGSPARIDEIVSAANGHKLINDLRVATLSYTDDAWQTSNEYALSGADAIKFKVIGDGLYLRKGTLLDYETVAGHKYDVTVTLSDPALPGSVTTSASFTLNLNNLDEAAPVFAPPTLSQPLPADGWIRVAENTSTSTVVYHAHATDDIAITRYSLKATDDSAAFSVDVSTGEVTFKASPDYETKDLYTITLVAEDAIGQLAEQLVKFKVTNLPDGGSDTRGPIVTAFSPADNTTKVALNSNIVLNFNEAIKRGAGDIVLKKLNGTVVETFDSSALTFTNDADHDTYSLTIDPSHQLDNNTMYIVDFATGAIQDVVGNGMQNAGVYNFRTIAGIAGVTTGSSDTVAPTVLSKVPADGATGVGVTNDIVLNFSEAIQRGSGSVMLKTASGVVFEMFDIASSDRISIANDPVNNLYKLTVNPTDALAVNTKYVLAFDNGAVSDAAGNSYVDSGTYNFTTSSVGAYNITLDFNQATNLGQYKLDVENVVKIWESIIVGDLPDIVGEGGSVGIDDMLIKVVTKDLPNGVLGIGGYDATRSAADNYLPYLGTVSLDVAKLATLSDVDRQSLLVHEIGHALGMGTLWGQRGFNSTVGQYTGENALEIYRQLSGNASAEYVPLELGGGMGTRNSHWSEALFKNEVMTGYLDGGTDVISKLTVAAFEDLGYQVNYSAAKVSATYALAGFTPAPLLVDVAYTDQTSLQMGHAVI